MKELVGGSIGEWIETGRGAAQAAGARPLRRAVAVTLEDAVADAILDGSLRAGDVATALLSRAAAAAAARGQPLQPGPQCVALRIRRGALDDERPHQVR